MAQANRVLAIGVAVGKIKATNKPFEDHWVFDITVQSGKIAKIRGVAVVAFAPGHAVERWMSEMAVVGHLTDHTNGEKGNNLLAIAYAKASEMANTLQNSGTSGKPPMTGEFGWEGGVVKQVANGYLIVAFSGGKSEDDVATSKAGLAVLEGKL